MNALGLWYLCKDQSVSITEHIHYLNTEKLFKEHESFSKGPRGPVQDSEITLAV